jgi:hypothetical protein
VPAAAPDRCPGPPMRAFHAVFAQSLQILVKSRSFEFSEKMRLIRIEYGEKANRPANRGFKPCC